MSSMFFKNILIADVQNHTARYVQFQKGLNVITSKDNHVGKSSVVKSLYDALGAEVHFDPSWGKDTKLVAVTIDVDDEEYRVIRFVKKYAILKGKELILLDDSVTRKLAPQLAKIFDFSVYLAEKGESKKVVQAPPAFTFMPYYIDQDKGWSELYNSFERMEQFAKPERAKSLYFHLGLYNKSRIELQAKKDQLKEETKALQEEEQKLTITINALSEELNSIIPADNEEELERHLSTPKKEIEGLVQKIGKVRNKIQELQTALQQHESQLETIRKYQKIKVPGRKKEKDEESLHVCPRCGYEFDDELYEIIRNNYNQSNAEYLLAQVELIVNNLREELKEYKIQYVSLMETLKKHEKAYDESQNAYEAYLRHRGLRETVRKYQLELAHNRMEQADNDAEIKEINKELKKIPDKSEIEQIYVDHVKRNIIALSAWRQEYDGKIKLLKELHAQGSLLPKIILSEYIGLFQTMESLDSPVIRFPFIVDSPRDKESSVTSSKEILNMIAKLSSLPQVILATVDYDEFEVEDGDRVNKIYLTEKFKVLNESFYNQYAEEIEGLHRLMTN